MALPAFVFRELSLAKQIIQQGTTYKTIKNPTSVKNEAGFHHPKKNPSARFAVSVFQRPKKLCALSALRG
jgi:hypothetical protein